MKDSVVRELRAVQRYSVSLPVCMTRRAGGAPHPSLNGFTRDISTRGMFVVADAELAEGELLEFEIDLALDEATPLVMVQGEGLVVRTERPSEHPAGFAVHNVWFRLREPEQGQALPIDLQTLVGDLSTRPPASISKLSRRRGLSIVSPQRKTDSDQGESQ